MSTTKTPTVKADNEPKERNWAIPDQVVSLEEIQTAIKSAEKGPFMKVQEAMNDFEQWLGLRLSVQYEPRMQVLNHLKQDLPQYYSR